MVSSNLVERLQMWLAMYTDQDEKVKGQGHKLT